MQVSRQHLNYIAKDCLSELYVSFKRFMHFYWKGRFKERQEKDIPSIGSHPKWLRQLWSSQLEASCLVWVSHTEAGSQGSRPSSSAFQEDGREPRGKWSKQDTNWLPHGMPVPARDDYPNEPFCQLQKSVYAKQSTSNMFSLQFMFWTNPNHFSCLNTEHFFIYSAKWSNS